MEKLERREGKDFKSFLEYVIRDDVKMLPDLFLTLIDVLPEEVRDSFYIKAYRDISKVMEAENNKKMFGKV